MSEQDLRTKATDLLKEAGEKTLKAQELLKQAGDKCALYQLQQIISDRLEADHPLPGFSFDTEDDPYYVLGKPIKGKEKRQQSLAILKTAVKVAIEKTEKETDPEKRADMIASMLLNIRENRNWITQIDCSVCKGDHYMSVEFVSSWFVGRTEDKEGKRIPLDAVKLGSHMDLNIVQRYDGCSLWSRIKWAWRDAKNIIFKKEGWHDICLDTCMGSDSYLALKDILNIL